MFNYDPDVDCAYFSLTNPISTTVCEELCEIVILEYDATNTLVGVELLFIQQLFLPDLEPLKRFLPWNSYQELLVNVGKNKFVKTAHKH
jgi:uncharacterized protein YuzE